MSSLKLLYSYELNMTDDKILKKYNEEISEITFWCELAYFIS
jgi:hypothetical protein